jgi:demethylmenaquinone methyltransferase/2-methoxy-6-polyprenyl-1,4-benzoquinol methylase
MDEIKSYYSLVEAAFGKLAPYYDLICLPISGLREQVANILTSTTALRVLDVATGTGAQAIAFAKRGHYVTGIDLSAAMIRIAQSKRKVENLNFEVGDASHLPYPNDSFDVSCISFALHDMPLPIRQKVLAEMLRVTKTQGTIIIVDYGLPRNRLGSFLIYRLVRLYERPYYSEFIKSELQNLLQETGIEILEDCPVLFGAARIVRGSSR